MEVARVTLQEWGQRFISQALSQSSRLWLRACEIYFNH